MPKVLANDGISPDGAKMLKEAGFELVTEKVPQEKLIEEIKNKGYDVLLVRSATKVTKEIIEGCPSLKLLCRGGVGLDNIDQEAAKARGIPVRNTPAASSPSVAELTIAHLLAGCRFLHESNRKMPIAGDFTPLKKKMEGIEVAGKTLGIIGIGMIGKEVAKRALGLGMKVIATDPITSEAKVKVDIAGTPGVEVLIKTIPLEDLLKQSDFITLHTPMPKDKKPILGKPEIEKMKKGVFLINIARGGVIDEGALIEALKSGQVGFAGVDVFLNEPKPREDLLKLDNISVTPHIGGATKEAQTRISTEIAGIIIQHFKK